MCKNTDITVGYTGLRCTVGEFNNMSDTEKEIYHWGFGPNLIKTRKVLKEELGLDTFVVTEIIKTNFGVEPYKTFVYHYMLVGAGRNISIDADWVVVEDAISILCFCNDELVIE